MVQLAALIACQAVNEYRVMLGGCEPQLGGHVAANLSVGNDRRTLLSVVTQLLPFIGYPRTLNAIRVIDEGTSARSEGSSR